MSVDNGDITYEQIDVFKRVIHSVERLNLKDATCHSVADLIAKTIHFKGILKAVHGKFADMDHSWLVFRAAPKVIIDPYPWACASGPLLLTMEASSPWGRLYVADPESNLTLSQFDMVQAMKVGDQVIDLVSDRVCTVVEFGEEKWLMINNRVVSRPADDKPWDQCHRPVPDPGSDPGQIEATQAKLDTLSIGTIIRSKQGGTVYTVVSNYLADHIHAKALVNGTTAYQINQIFSSAELESPWTSVFTILNGEK